MYETVPLRGGFLCWVEGTSVAARIPKGGICKGMRRPLDGPTGGPEGLRRGRCPRRPSVGRDDPARRPKAKPPPLGLCPQVRAASDCPVGDLMWPPAVGRYPCRGRRPGAPPKPPPMGEVPSVARRKGRRGFRRLRAAGPFAHGGKGTKTPPGVGPGGQGPTGASPPDPRSTGDALLGP